ncbi:MAG: hypothetical protein K2I87_04230 [Bacteroidales bacterium]|nr:hypothetical protein [Bacteroidales bacterium]
MKNLWASLWFLLGAGLLRGQDYPPDWVKYTLGGYYYNIQAAGNTRNQEESGFKDYLTQLARTNLAQTVQVRVQDEAVLRRESLNGHTGTAYSSQTRFSTEVDLRFVETESRYDPVSRKGYAIAYIEKQAARRYYQAELQMLFGKLENARSLANNYVATGFKAKAKECLEEVLPVFGQMESPFFWLVFFGTPQAEMSGYVEKRNAMEQEIRRMIADLEHGNRIYLSCSAYLGAQAYPKLPNELKGVLSAKGCSFVSSPEQADWVIGVSASSRDHNRHESGGYVTYFSYVDAEVTIDKVATRQRIFADEISVKGGHTLNFTEAARAAYKEVSKEIGNAIKEIINK